MQNGNSGDYYRGREQHALRLARNAIDDNIRAIHLVMADEYGRLASEHSSYADSRDKYAVG